MTSPPPDWLRGVLSDLERAMVLLVDAQVGRTRDDIELVVLRVDELLNGAEGTFRARSYALTASAVHRASSIFAATYALRCRVVELHGRPDHDLAALLRRVERPTN